MTKQTGKMVRILKRTLALVGAVVALLLILVLTPEIWFRDDVIKRVANWIGSDNRMSLNWSSLQTDITRPSWHTIQVSIQAQRLEIDSESIFTQLDDVDLQANIKWFALPPRLSAVPQLLVRSSKTAIKPSPSNAQTNDESNWTLPSLQGFIIPWLRNASWGNLNINVSNFSANDLSLSFDLETTLDTDALKLTVRERKKRYAADLRVPLAKDRTARWEFLSGSSRIEVSAGTVLSLDFRSQIKEEQIHLTISSASLKSTKFRSNVELQKPCHIRLREKRGSTISASFDCELLGATSPTKNTIELDIFTKADVDVTKKNGILHYNGEIGFNTEVDRIEKLIALFRNTQWAIPAPLNNFNGPLRLDLRIKLDDRDATVPFQFATNLKSKQQRFKSTTTGTLDIKRLSPEIAGTIQADVLLEDIRLSAPRLNVTELPRMTPDDRILSQSEYMRQRSDVLSAVEKPDNIQFKVQIRSSNDKPVLVDSNLVPEPIAIDVNLTASSSDALVGKIHVRPMKLEIFRKTAQLEHFDLHLNGSDRPTIIDGKASIPTGDYTVFGELSGTTENARLTASSEPPVPENEIWAILLFGEPLNALDLEQQDTAKSTEQALASGALGLFSLYTFANTPIERVNYDPATGKVSVQFRLGRRTTLTVGGTGQESQSVGLRRRLGRGWALEGEVSTDESVSGTPTAGATLEWSKRY